MNTFARCPFCGHQPDEDNLIDSFHPTGTFYAPFDRERPELGYAYSRKREGAEGQIWSFSCLETEGGCGAEMTGHGPEEVKEKWNRRTP